jgi:DNA-binding NarL/FixJ family response regulator
MSKTHADDGTARIDHRPRTDGRASAATAVRVVVVDQDEIRARRITSALADAAGVQVEGRSRLHDLAAAGDERIVALIRLTDAVAAEPLDPPSAGVHVIALVAAMRDARRALAHGAHSALLDDADPATLAAAVQLAAAGLSVRPVALQAGSTRRALTAREKQVLALVVMGFANREIAAQLHVTDRTVKSHLSSVFRKLGVTSRHEATAAVLDTETGAGLGVVGLT